MRKQGIGAHTIHGWFGFASSGLEAADGNCWDSKRLCSACRKRPTEAAKSVALDQTSVECLSRKQALQERTMPSSVLHSIARCNAGSIVPANLMNSELDCVL